MLVFRRSTEVKRKGDDYYDDDDDGDLAKKKRITYGMRFNIPRVYIYILFFSSKISLL